MSSVEQYSKPKSLRVRGDLINLEDEYLNRSIMDVHVRKGRLIPNYVEAEAEKKKKVDDRRSLLRQGQGKRNMMFRYFTLESLFLLVCLTASLLILPLILPPLPPPPSMLLLLPILILGLLMLLAFMPSNARKVTHTCL